MDGSQRKGWFSRGVTYKKRVKRAADVGRRDSFESAPNKGENTWAHLYTHADVEFATLGGSLPNMAHRENRWNPSTFASHLSILGLAAQVYLTIGHLREKQPRE